MSTDNFYTLNDDGLAAGSKVKVLILGPHMDVSKVQPQKGLRVVISPSTCGFVLNRLLVLDRSDEPRYQKLYRDGFAAEQVQSTALAKDFTSNSTALTAISTAAAAVGSSGASQRVAAVAANVASSPITFAALSWAAVAARMFHSRGASLPASFLQAGMAGVLTHGAGALFTQRVFWKVACVFSFPFSRSLPLLWICLISNSIPPSPSPSPSPSPPLPVPLLQCTTYYAPAINPGWPVEHSSHCR